MSKLHLGHENKVLNNALMDDQRGVVDGAGDDGGPVYGWMSWISMSGGIDTMIGYEVYEEH
jgi:uncharacterized membrane protein